MNPTRAHVVGCPKALSVPVDLCACGGRDFAPDMRNGIVTQIPHVCGYDQACAACEIADLRDTLRILGERGTAAGKIGESLGLSENILVVPVKETP